ncbi:MAG TPA: glycosyl hydrolase 108 family protein [Steroidobacteraceae bacterium]|nr:glycosyl hydrolase 108 family protein [Steroidobacteraceae bacterium]
MASLERFFPHLLRFEGGFVNDPADPGGATNKGITIATFQRYAPAVLGVAPSLDNLRALSDAQAFSIYKVGYWDPLHADEIVDQPLAEIVFDFHVNAGATAVRVLQGALNDSGVKPQLPVDGVVGPGTLQALQGTDPVGLYRTYKQRRIEYYQDLVARRPSLAKFLNGWLKRVNSFPDR